MRQLRRMYILLRQICKIGRKKPSILGMNKPNVLHITETAGAFRRLADEHGGLYLLGEGQKEVPHPPLRYVSGELIRRHPHLNEFVAQGAGLVPVGPNFGQLLQSPGREFGLVKPGEGIFPAVITAQSRRPRSRAPGVIVVAYLASDWDKIDPKDIGKGAGDPLTSMLLKTASTLSLPTIAAHNENGQMLPGELGHRYGGLRTLSDPNAHEAILRGVDVTDRLANGVDFASKLTQYGTDKRSRKIPGAFDMVDDRGNVRRITYRLVGFGADSSALLIDHPNFNNDVSELLGGMMPAVAATGLAIVSKISREQPVDPGRAVTTYGQQALGLR